MGKKATNAWVAAAKAQQEKREKVETHAESPAAATEVDPRRVGYCVPCGSSSFRLKYIDHKLCRICKGCGDTIYDV